MQQSQTAVTTATANLQSALAEQLKLDKQVAAIRKELAEAETAADAAAASVDLGKKLVLLREQAAKVLEAEAALSEQKQIDAASADLAEAGRNAAGAKSALTEAEALAKRREKAEKAATEAPLTILADDTKKLKTTPPFNKPFLDAKTRIEQDIPGEAAGACDGPAKGIEGRD